MHDVPVLQSIQVPSIKAVFNCPALLRMDIVILPWGHRWERVSDGSSTYYTYVEVYVIFGSFHIRNILWELKRVG